MLALRRVHDAPSITPFRTGQEAWLWTMAILMARRDGAGQSWRPEGPPRPCDPEDVVRCLDTLYREGVLDLVHARILRIWGERQTAPRSDRLQQRGDWRLWNQALGHMEWVLRACGVVR